jgi:hypothetical protein
LSAPAAVTENIPARTKPKDLMLLAAITAASFLVHGYHPYVEDAEIYVPGIKKLLNPALYPYNQAFFASHARLTLFPNLIAGSIRLTHLPADCALLAWQFVCVFVFLYACWKIGRLVFADPFVTWGGVTLVASLLTIPVAGTALYIMDQYLTARSVSTATVLMLVANATERHYGRAALWGVLTAAVHPLMVVFGVSYVLILEWFRSKDVANTPVVVLAALLPFGLFPPPTDSYRSIIGTHFYFFLLKWEWYEWLGIFGPLVLFWWFGRIARKNEFPMLATMCRALLAFGVIFFAAGVVLTIPDRFFQFAELQPMRALHLEYTLMFVFGGGLLAQFVLGRHLWRWLALFIPLCGGMFYAGRELFPATPHLEMPGAAANNAWVETFLWVRQNTPVDAYFALNPDHMELPGEDQHGFRALAERAMLADRVKDSGAVTMFPNLADTWTEQFNDQKDWKKFQAEDFRRLKKKYGVTWVVLEKPAVAGLACPYENERLTVCRIE